MVVKGEINRVLEKLKKEGTIKSSLEVDISILSGKRIIDIWFSDSFNSVPSEELEDSFLCSNVLRILTWLV